MVAPTIANYSSPEAVVLIDPVSGNAYAPSFSNAAGPARVLAQGAVPVILLPTAQYANNGVFSIGSTPASAATVSFSATSGSGVTMTFSAGTPLVGSANDVGRVLTILDTTLKYATVTAGSSTTAATVTLTGTLSGTGPFANNAIWWSGTVPPISNATTTIYPSTMAQAYANCWVFVPTNAISAATPSGIYFCQMVNVTNGVLFNNQLAAGTVPNSASIPASPTAFVTTGNGSVSNTTSSNIQVVSVSIPANGMGANGYIDYGGTFSCCNSAGSKQGQTFFGGGVASVAATTNVQSPLRGYIGNRGVTNSQIIYTGNGFTPQAQLPSYQTVDTTAASSLLYRLNIAAATDIAWWESLFAELYPG